MNELRKQNINNKYIYKNINKKFIYTNKSSVKYGQVNRPYKKWIQKKPFMVSCITPLIILVLYNRKFSSSTKSRHFWKVFCTSMLESYFTKVADFHRGCFPRLLKFLKNDHNCFSLGSNYSENVVSNLVTRWFLH